MCGAEYSPGARTGQTDAMATSSGNGIPGPAIELAIPKLREGSYFPDWLLERRKRAEKALISVVATSYLLGVSTRRMEKLVETARRHPAVEVPGDVMAKDLDAQVEAFRTRPLDAGPYTFLAADALTMKSAKRPGGQRRLPGRHRGERRRAPRDPRPGRVLGRVPCRLAHLLSRPDRPRPVRGVPAHLRRPLRPGRRRRSDPSGRIVATMPDPLCGEPDAGHPEVVLGLGEGVAALGL